MPRTTPETLLISAAINSRDPYFWKKWQIVSAHFHGYRDQAEWLEAFGNDYRRTPSWVEFNSRWEDFPADLDQEDGFYPATEVIRQYNTRVSTRAMLRASNFIKAGEVDEGLELIRTMNTHTISRGASNILSDASLLEDYHKPQDRIPVPWRSLQDRTLGIGPGELWYLGARPSQGKSIHTTYMAAHAALQGRRVMMFSMEMTRQAMTIRLHVMLAQMLKAPVSHHALRTRRIDPREYQKLLDLIKEKVPGVVHVHTPSDGPCRPSVIASRAGDYDLTVVDHMGLMRPEGHGRAVDDWRVAASLSNEMKEIALARNTRIIAASQINREGDQGFKPPKMSQLSQSDALGQDGDVVLTLAKYRRVNGASHFSIEKNREGEAGVPFFTRFDVDSGSLEEITRSEADEIALEHEYED